MSGLPRKRKKRRRGPERLGGDRWGVKPGDLGLPADCVVGVFADELADDGGIIAGRTRMYMKDIVSGIAACLGLARVLSQMPDEVDPFLRARLAELVHAAETGPPERPKQ